MPVRIEQAAEQAHRLVETGEVAAAQATLHEALATVDPDPAYASPELADAAALYARVLVALDESAVARRWAAYAHTASRRLHGADDERTMQTASVLAGVLQRVGAYSRSAHLYRELVDQLSALDGPRSSRVLAARADLATVLHARGECADARTLLAKTWTAYRYLYGEGHPVGIKMLARLGAMERDCGLTEQAQERFALAESLCRRHLPAGHRLAGQIAALADMPADRGHTCSEQLTDSAPTTDSAPLTDPERPAGSESMAGAEPLADDDPEGGTAAELMPSEARTTMARTTMTDVAPRPSAVVASPRHLRDEPSGLVVWRRQRMTLAAVAALAIAVVTGLTIATGALIAMARTNDDERGGVPAPIPATSASRAAPSSPAKPTSAAPSPVPTTTRPAPQASGPPTAVALIDNGTSVTLTWKYPQGATSSVVLSAGRSGQARHTIQTLPADTSRFTVYGLSDTQDFCFTVGIAYAGNRVATSPAVCTRRP